MDWESICDGCAQCCAIWDNDNKTNVACPSLGPDNRCQSYNNRFEVEMCTKVTPDNLDLLREAGVLPDSCAYLGGTEPVRAKLVPFNLADAALQKRHLETRNLCLKMLSEDK